MVYKDFIEKTFIGVALVILSGAIIPLYLEQSGVTNSLIDGNPLQQSIYISIYIIAVVFLLINKRHLAGTVKSSVWIYLLVLLTFISILWSEFPSLTLRRAIAITGTTLFGLYLASFTDKYKVLRLLGSTLLLLIFLSYLVIFIIPEFGIRNYYDGWNGVFVHKNVLGRISVLSIITFLSLIKENNRNGIWAVGITLALGIIIGSKSSTSLIVSLLLFSIVPFLRILQIKKQNEYLFLSIVIGLGLVLTWILFYTYTKYEAIVSYFGKDITLTGRTLIWDSVLIMIVRKPWLGYGFDAFWLGNDGPSGVIWESAGRPVHSHNGFLDLALGVGILGVIFFVLSYIAVFRKSVANYIRQCKNEIPSIWPILFLLFLFFHNLTESAILARNSLYWALYVMVAFGEVNPTKERI